MYSFLEKLPEIITVFCFGAVFGSFATMASHRMPLGEDMILKSSACPKCKHKLGFLDLFPILTWLFSGGKCRHCRAKISVRYPLTEFALAAIFVVIYLKFGFSLTAFALYYTSVILVIMSVIDIEKQIIPNLIHILLLPGAVLYAYSTEQSWTYSAVGFVAALLATLALRYIFWLWKKKEGLGMGDVKFFAIAGIFIGWQGLVPFMFYAGILGIFSGLLWKRLGKGEQYPFGPALAIALFICILTPKLLIEYIGS